MNLNQNHQIYAYNCKFKKNAPGRGSVNAQESEGGKRMVHWGQRARIE